MRVIFRPAAKAPRLTLPATKYENENENENDNTGLLLTSNHGRWCTELKLRFSCDFTLISRLYCAFDLHFQIRLKVKVYIHTQPHKCNLLILHSSPLSRPISPVVTPTLSESEVFLSADNLWGRVTHTHTQAFNSRLSLTEVN